MTYKLFITLLIIANDGYPKNVTYNGPYTAFFNTKEQCEIALKAFSDQDYKRDGVFVYDAKCRGD